MSISYRLKSAPTQNNNKFLSNNGPASNFSRSGSKENENGENEKSTTGRFQRLPSSAKGHYVKPKVLKYSEFLDLIDRNRFEPKERRELALFEEENRKDRVIKESMARKDKIRRIDSKRAQEKQTRMDEIDEEARQRTQHLLERAENMKLEEAEEIKKCNKLILETKCRAIRDAQLEEKKLLERNYLEEELRANREMEEQRLQSIQDEQRKEQEKIAKQAEFSQNLRLQLMANEEERLLEDERKREESRLINLNNIAQQEAELARIKARGLESEKLKKDLAECNERLRHLKAMEEEENRMMDVRIKMFNMSREERQAKYEQEMRQEFLRREREKDRISAAAQQNQELEAHIQEINMAKIQEEVEREWRKREKEEAMRRLENLNKLLKDRQTQVNSKIRMQAIELQREKEEFDRILALQKEALKIEEERHKKKRQQSLNYRREILKQVNEKEKQRIAFRQKMFEESKAQQAEIELRKKRLKEVIERKCNEMRENKVPENYVKEVKNLIQKVA